MTLRGRKQGRTVLLDVEPPVADGTEVEVRLPRHSDQPGRLQAQYESLMRVGYHPDFGEGLEKIREEWKPEEF